MNSARASDWDGAAGCGGRTGPTRCAPRRVGSRRGPCAAARGLPANAEALYAPAYDDDGRHLDLPVRRPWPSFSMSLATRRALELLHLTLGALTELVVFVASPSDCADERLRVRQAAAAVTEVLGTGLDVRIRVTGWELQPPELGRPQQQINPLVDRCDVFIGVMNRRWGSSTGTHSSGFLEEFELAAARRATCDVPKIALWFRTVPDELVSDPGVSCNRCSTSNVASEMNTSRSTTRSKTRTTWKRSWSCT